jgi:hypothetical protein
MEVKAMLSKDTRQQVKLPPDAHRQLKAWAALRGLTIQQAVLQAVLALLGQGDVEPREPVGA